MFLQYLKSEVRDEVYFLYPDKHQRFLQVDFNVLAIKVSYKVILSLLLGMIKHSQSAQCNKFALFLRYIKKEGTIGAHSFHVDKNQSFYKLALLFLMKAIRTPNLQSTQDRKLVIFLQYIIQKVSELLLCAIVMQNIQIFYGG